MSVELPLSTSTRQVLKLAIDRLMTRASLWGWWSRRVSSLVKLMVGLSTLVIFGSRLEIWTLCSVHKYVFLAFLEELAIMLPPCVHSYLSKRSLRCFLVRWFSSGSLSWFFLPLTNCCGFPCLMRASICFFKSQHLEVSCLFLRLLFGSPFSLSSQFSVMSSLIYTRTQSSGVFSRVKLIVLLGGGFDLLSSLQSFVRVEFLSLSWWGLSCLSFFFSSPL